MDSFNKVISFVLGLVIVVVFLAIISGKINLKKTFPQLAGKITLKTSPTPTPKSTAVPTSTTAGSNTSTSINTSGNTKYQSTTNTGKTTSPKTIPATGSPTILIPSLISMLASGLYLRKRS